MVRTVGLVTALQMAAASAASFVCRSAYGLVAFSRAEFTKRHPRRPDQSLDLDQPLPASVIERVGYSSGLLRPRPMTGKGAKPESADLQHELPLSAECGPSLVLGE